jgi:dynein heavy chain
VQTAKRFDADLKELIALIQNDLKPPQRVSLASMITQHMHHKEAFDELVKAKIKDIFDFEWQKQLRADWKSDEDQCVIQMMDIRMIYQNEYLGCKERLVVTPLTSRCYITIFQTLSMHLGVAAFGSSAAGKTMVIKDIGRTLGQYVVVVNCSSHLGVSGLSKILKGVAMAGLCLHLFLFLIASK